VTADGYGVGTRELDALSNGVRALVLQDESKSETAERDEVRRIVAEIDDMAPEHLADAADALAKQGALDVVREPVRMKKGRQGTRLSVLVQPDDVDDLVDAIFAHTTTFGVRVDRHERQKLARATTTVETRYGDVPLKIGRRRGVIRQVSPEYEACRRIARDHDVPVERIYRAAEAAAAEHFDW